MHTHFFLHMSLLSKRSPIDPIHNILLRQSIVSNSFGKFSALQSMSLHQTTDVRPLRLQQFHGHLTVYMCVNFSPTRGSMGWLPQPGFWAVVTGGAALLISQLTMEHLQLCAGLWIALNFVGTVGVLRGVCYVSVSALRHAATASVAVELWCRWRCESPAACLCITAFDAPVGPDVEEVGGAVDGWLLSVFVDSSDVCLKKLCCSA